MLQVDTQGFTAIPEYEGLYCVNESGDIYSTYRHRLLKPTPDKNGYLTVELTKNKIHKRIKVSRIVAVTFIPNPENKPQVNHKNGIKARNHYLNLEWVNNSENQKHAYGNGLKHANENQKAAAKICGYMSRKLTFDDAEKIRKLHKEGKVKRKELPMMFGLSRQGIDRILTYKSYAQDWAKASTSNNDVENRKEMGV